MDLLEAKEILEKLKPLEKKGYTKDGLPIHRFFLIPLKHLRKNNIKIDWFEIWYNQEIYETDIYKNLDFTIVGVHRSAYNTFWTSNVSKNFIRLMETEDEG